MRSKVCFFVFCLNLFLMFAGFAAEESAKDIFSATGVKGGLIVHLGCGDGKLTAALYAGDQYRVHGLDGDIGNVEKARASVRSLGLYGPISIEKLSGTSLPYADNLVNLLVAEKPGGVSEKEMMRALVPNGVAYIKKGNAWTKVIKPWPTDIAEWTHFLCTPDNNAVVKDSVVGPPKQMQWVGNPKWSRNHHAPSVTSVVSSGGRLFTIVDEGATFDSSKIKVHKKYKVITEWKLIVRDAFNGIVLWKKPFQSWTPLGMGFKNSVFRYQRRMVAIDDRLYLTLGLFAPISVFDASSGELIRTYDGTENTDEFIYVDGKIVALAQDKEGSKKGKLYAKANSIFCLDVKTGEFLWKKSMSNSMQGVLASKNGRVMYPDNGNLVSVDLVTGKENWRLPDLVPIKSMMARFTTITLVMLEKVVLYADGKVLIGFESTTGKKLWSIPCLTGYQNAPDVLFASGLVWATENASDKKSGSFSVGRDPMTGEVKKEMDTTEIWDPGDMGHHRCYRNKITDTQLLVGQSGTVFVDFETGRIERNDWVRGCCGYGVLPCNGLLYAPSHACGCYTEGMLNGFWALAPAGTEMPDVAERLESGSVQGEIEVKNASPEDWPTHRHDAVRSASTKTVVPTTLKTLWQAKVGNKLSAVVCAEGILLVAELDEHTVYALDAKTGKKVWQFTAGGAVDSPPTIAKGLAVFGAKDGCVYCLRLSDGKLVWRYRGTSKDRRVIALGSLESVWPAHGSVLVLGDTVCFAAGRSSFIDGGIRLNRLALKTGKSLSETIIYAVDPKTGKQPTPYKLVLLEDSPATVALPDILSSDGSSIYMRHTKFTLEGTLQKERKAHLFSSAGFLNDKWFHRTYWAWTKDFGSAVQGWSMPGHIAPAGRLMVVGDDVLYGFGRMTYKEATSFPPYHLFQSEKKDRITREGVTVQSGGRVKGSFPEAKKGFFRKFNWSQKEIPFTIRAMLLSDKTLFAAGPIGNIVNSPEARAGTLGSTLWAISSSDGKKITEYELPAPPVFDGMVAARKKLYISLLDGSVICMGE